MWSRDFREKEVRAGSNRLSAPFVQVYHMGYMDYLPGWYFFWHMHEHSTELSVVVSGRGIFHVGNQEIPLERGSVCIVPPHVLHYYSCEEGEGLKYYCFGFRAEDPRNELLSFFRNLECSVISLGSRASYLEETCHMLEERLDQTGYRADELYQSLFTGMLFWLRGRAEEQHVAPVSRSAVEIQDILSYISVHYAEKLTLASLSHQFGISQTQLGRLFRKTCRLSPVNYIIYFRITQAIILLRQTDQSIAKVTEAVGYQNPAHFTRLFHEYIGYTPLEFRKKARVEQAQNCQAQLKAGWSDRNMAWSDRDINRKTQ